MLYFGTAITAPSDPLRPVAIEDLYHSLRNPKPRIRQLVDQLRIMQTLDKSAYKVQKKLLPYLVCAAFKPAIRRRENFLNTEYFIIDLDGVSNHFSKEALCEKLISDPQLLLLFTSPGGDGLKLLFRLKEKCSDYGLFSAFYKQFIQNLAARFHLHPVMDTATSDVTRACFISYDENAFYNPRANFVDMASYNAFEPDTLWEAAQKATVAFKKEKEKEIDLTPVIKPAALAGDIMIAIRQKLNPDYRRPVKKQYYIPPQVDDYIQKISEELKQFNLQLIESNPINYGRKLKIGTNGIWAEINLFYGSRGFTFVKTTKTGSNGELAELCVQVLEQNLYPSNPKQ